MNIIQLLILSLLKIKMIIISCCSVLQDEWLQKMDGCVVAVVAVAKQKKKNPKPKQPAAAAASLIQHTVIATP